jgi:hypothetical protein
MKHLTTAIMVLAVLTAAVVYSVTGAPSSESAAKVKVQSEAKNPWTNLDLDNKASNFRFAIVTDRTGGMRPGVFAKGVTKINLLQPEFVVSVGDLIQGYTEDPKQWETEWSEFEKIIGKLESPFFYCAGNHDYSNLPMSKDWKTRFGRSYYEFRYHDVLFLVLNSEEKPAPNKSPYFIGEEQREWAAGVLDRNQDVRWTFVILHKPTWTYPEADHAELGWKSVEDALQGRKYTVFSGHKHAYAKYIRKGQEYYMLATTGGGSSLSGLEDGRFDHFVWVTMQEDKPRIANLLLDGVEDSDVRVLPNPQPENK